MFIEDDLKQINSRNGFEAQTRFEITETSSQIAKIQKQLDFD